MNDRLAAIEAVVRRGNFAEAEPRLTAYLADLPDDADALALFGLMRLQQGRRRDAEPYFQRAIETDPSSANAHYALFDLAFSDERYPDALHHLRAMPEPFRSDFHLVSREAECLSRLGRHDEELAIYERLIAAHPDMSSLRIAKANALRLVGRSEDAEATARDVIAKDPAYPTAWWLLSDLKNVAFSDDDFARLEGLITHREPTEADAPLHFAMAKAFEDRGDIASAMHHFTIGNDVRLHAGDRVGPGVAPKVDRSIATFDAGFFAARAGWGDAQSRPIFVVGQHRAGSTLIEQVLASHPAIEGLGELPLIPQLMRHVGSDGDLFDRIAALDRDEVADLARLYRERAAAYRHTDRPMMVDKLPGNWSNLGFIRLLFPNSVIIDARRHPMGCGLSNYRQNFSTGALYSRSLSLFGEYYRQYVRYMDHVDGLFPGWVHRVIHERLVQDPERAIRTMIDRVGLPFDDACLSFHTNTRTVRTPSANQVRRPIDPSASQRWQDYADFLGPLREALGDVLDDWERVPTDGGAS